MQSEKSLDTLGTLSLTCRRIKRNKFISLGNMRTVVRPNFVITHFNWRRTADQRG
jgi:hypothetical protein